MCEAIDPGVRRLVAFLNEHGFETCDSGDGKTKFEAEEPDACALDFPNVSMIVDQPEKLATECDRLMEVLATVGIQIEAMPDDPVMPPTIQGDYDPITKFASIHLFGVDDEMLGFK